MDRPPNTTNPFGMFIKSQFLTKLKAPPSTLQLKGDTAIVTGSNIGIGLATVSVLLDYGVSRVIMAVRSVDKGEAAALPLRKQYPDATIDVWHLDMMSYPSIQDFCQNCDSLSRLDKVILNAGIAKKDFTTHPDTGHEEIMQVNYLSTALLGLLLIPILKRHRPENGPGRLTFVTSTMAFTYKFPDLDVEPLLPSFDAPGTSTADAFARYSSSKLMLLFFVRKLAQVTDSKDVIINAVEPGMVVKSGLTREATGWVSFVNKAVGTVASRSPEEGAWTYADALCVKGTESHGGVIMDCAISGYPPVMYGEKGQQISERLWKETLAELSFANMQGAVQTEEATNL